MHMFTERYELRAALQLALTTIQRMEAGQRVGTSAALLILCRVLENTKDESTLDSDGTTESIDPLASLVSTLVRCRLGQNILN